MTNKEESIEILKMKLKSSTKWKLQRERVFSSILLKEQSLQEQFRTFKAENEFLKEQLEDIKNQIGQHKHQISMINICSTSEKRKINEHIKNLEAYRQGFTEMFQKERDKQEQKIKAQEAIVQQELEQTKLREEQKAKLKENQLNEIASLEAQCRNIESECAVLKKRNNAIMLKLRRQLIETENIRREILKRKGPAC